jgi:hypothetical protein
MESLIVADVQLHGKATPAATREIAFPARVRMVEHAPPTTAMTSELENFHFSVLAQVDTRVSSVLNGPADLVMPLLA